MSKLDQKYIDNLQKFTDALEGLVEQMKSQQKEGTSDVVNEMLKNMDSKIDLVIKNQEDLKASQKNIKKDTSDILKEIKQIKNREKTGGLSAISETDNGKKVGDAVKSIILIAGGILAIGMAFKIVGNVDLASVVGLSIGILVAVEAFKKISEMDIGVTDMVFSGLMMTIMAGSLVVTGLILSRMPTMSIEQGLTLLLVAGSVGVATWLVMQGISKIDVKKNWSKILLMPLLLPLVATSIWLSSLILQNVVPISWKQALDIAVVGAAIGIATMFIGLSMIGMKKIDIKEALLLPVMIPLIAGSVVLASLIFQMFQPVKDPGELLLGSLVMGLSLLLMTPVIVIIGKTIGKDIKAATIGIFSIPLIAFGIVGTAWAFSLLPTDMKYPTLEWSLGSAISMLLFLPTMIIVGAIGMTGIGIAGLAIGLIGLPLIALSMVAVASILNSGDWTTNFPSLDWALGVGASLLLFGISTVLAAPAALVSGIFSFFGADDPLVKLAKSMVEVSKELQGGLWKSGYPTKDWADGVGGALYMFSGAFATIMAIKGVASLFGKTVDFNAFVKNAAEAMVTASNSLKGGNWVEGGYPSKKWADGVGGALYMFSGAFATIMTIKGVASLFGKTVDFNAFVKNAAEAMVTASNSLKGGNWVEGGYPSKKWADGVGGSLAYFASAFSSITGTENGGWFISKSKTDFNGFVEKAATSMVMASLILSGSDGNKKPEWGIYPKKEWADGVGGALVAFANAFSDISEAERGGWFSADKDFSLFITKAASAIKLASEMLSLGKWETYPEKTWVDNASYALIQMAKVINDADLDDDDMKDFKYFLTNILPNFKNLSNFPSLDPFVENVNKFVGVVNNLPDDKHKAIKNLSESIRDFSDALREVDMSTLDKLSTISQGVILVSIIDEAKLRGVLDTITEKQSELKEIYGDEEKEGVLSKFGNWASGLMGGEKESEKTSTVAVVKDDRDVAKEDFYNNIASIRSMMSEMMDMMNSPGMSGNFNKSK